MVPQNGDTSNGREVFVSYRRLDNDPPPDGPYRGFVDYLLTQVRYDLTQLGVPNAIFWQDRSKIAPADDWNADILSALNNAELFIAVLSKNYVTSDWCVKELNTMRLRAKTLGAPTPKGRIFRVDKHKVPEDKVPELLRTIQSVRFYREDRYSESIDEYFWRGKVRFIDEYEAAVKELAEGISKRLEDLGIPCQPKVQPEPRVDNAHPSNGRVVFVAKPAGDMVQSYRTLVRELRDTGFRITPDPDEDLSYVGEEVRSTVVKALGEAEASIHLLGTRTGGRPDGLDMDLVPMQLEAAAEEAKRRPGFERLIWAPIVLLSGTSAEAGMVRRNPLEILGQFGQRLLATDQIDGDTASRFNDFVLQRLGRKHRDPLAVSAGSDGGTSQSVRSEDIARLDKTPDPALLDRETSGSGQAALDELAEALTPVGLPAMAFAAELKTGRRNRHSAAATKSKRKVAKPACKEIKVSHRATGQHNEVRKGGSKRSRSKQVQI